MSLVLEALRRIDKPDAKPGSVGVAVASYRPVRRRRAVFVPLLMGLAVGGVIVFLFGPQSRKLTTPSFEGSVAPPGRPAFPELSAVAGAPDAQSASRTAQPRRTQPQEALSGPSLPAPAPAVRSDGRSGSEPAGALPSRSRPAAPATEPPVALTLQAVSERDSSPIAVINDQLVREGDLLDGVRVLKIGSDSVEVLRPNGARETVRFAPPPPPDASASPETR